MPKIDETVISKEDARACSEKHKKAVVNFYRKQLAKEKRGALKATIEKFEGTVTPPTLYRWNEELS